jgi:hypothetical protein
MFIPDLDPNIFHFGSRIRILKFFILDPRSFIKRGMKNKIKLPLFLLLTVPGASLNSQKDNSSRIRVPDKVKISPGSRK